MPKSITVFLAEDNPADVFLVKEALKECIDGLSFVIAEDGAKAVGMLLNEETPAPDLVLLDLNLPKVDGYEILKRIRGTQRFAELPIIVLTSSRSASDREKATAAGATSFVSKPIALQDFLTTIHNEICETWIRPLARV